jgi:hypothetical protein
MDFINPIMSTYSEQFRKRVEAFLAAHRFKPTEFGRQAVGDPSFVLNLRRGRSPTLATADKVVSFMASFEASGQRSSR